MLDAQRLIMRLCRVGCDVVVGSATHAGVCSIHTSGLAEW